MVKSFSEMLSNKNSNVCLILLPELPVHSLPGIRSFKEKEQGSVQMDKYYIIPWDLITIACWFIIASCADPGYISAENFLTLPYKMDGMN